jgi:hypothetical protein
VSCIHSQGKHLENKAILNTHCEHDVAVTVAGELRPIIRFLSHTVTLPCLKKKFPCVFTGLVSLLSEYLSFVRFTWTTLLHFYTEIFPVYDDLDTEDRGALQYVFF